MGFSRQEYWSGSPLPSPRDLPDPGIEPTRARTYPLLRALLGLARLWCGGRRLIFAASPSLLGGGGRRFGLPGPVLGTQHLLPDLDAQLLQPLVGPPAGGPSSGPFTEPGHVLRCPEVEKQIPGSGL